PFHVMQAPISETGAITQWPLHSSSSGYVTDFTNLAVILPVDFAAIVRKEHVFRFRLVENPERAARGAAHAFFGNAVNRERNGGVGRSIKSRHDPEGSARPPLLGGRPDEFDYAVMGSGMDVAGPTLEERRVPLIFRR